MKYLALLKDSACEALDRKSLFVLLALAGVLVFLCASLSFKPLDEAEALQEMAEGFGTVTGPPGASWRKDYDVPFRVENVRPLEGREGFAFGLVAGPSGELEALVRHWAAVRRREVEGRDDPVPEVAVTPELLERFIKDSFRAALLPNVSVDPAGERAWNVEIRGERRSLRGAEKASFLFGLVTWRPSSGGAYLSSAKFCAIVEAVIAQLFAGIVGLFVALVATAGSIPSLLRKGTVEVLFSRPVNRSSLLVARYLGGCTYVLLLGGVAIGGAWLALSLRTGHWNVYFPLTLLTLVFQFAVLSSVSLLAAVLTGSAAAAAFSALAAWGLSFGAGIAYVAVARSGPSALVPPVRFVYLMLPKSFDLVLLNVRLCEVGEGTGEPVPAGMLLLIVGTSALFALVMLAFACTAATRRDY